MKMTSNMVRGFRVRVSAGASTSMYTRISTLALSACLLSCGALVGSAQAQGVANSAALPASHPSPSPALPANGLTVLAQFIAHTQSGSARFVQTVTPPARQKTAGSGEAAVNTDVKPKNSSGRFAFLRPNRFRFDYDKPYIQHIVADGKTLWFYDADLQQVTVSVQAKALQATPAVLIANARSLQDLQKQFTLTALDAEQAPKLGGTGQALSWIEARPKVAGGTLQVLRVGFATTAQGVQLRALDMQDSFGQRSLLQFEPFQTAVSASVFHFQPPAGVAVVHQ